MEYKESSSASARPSWPARGGEGSVSLRQNGELTYEQIAELRHVPVGTVKRRCAAPWRSCENYLN